MFPVLLLLASLSAGPDVGALRRELDAVASQIADLKARRLAGEAVEEGALERLLVRSQELAEEIDEARPHPAAAAAEHDPRCELVDDLREQAAELRAEADALAAEAERLGEAIARASQPEPVTSQLPTVSRDAPPAPTVRALADRRALLERRARKLTAQASILEAAADTLERARAAAQGAVRPAVP